MTVWQVWSWNERHSMWICVFEGTKSEAAGILVRKRQAAAKLMPSARFTMTAPGSVPTERPDDEP